MSKILKSKSPSEHLANKNETVNWFNLKKNTASLNTIQRVNKVDNSRKF